MSARHSIFAGNLISGYIWYIVIIHGDS